MADNQARAWRALTNALRVFGFVTVTVTMTVTSANAAPSANDAPSVVSSKHVLYVTRLTHRDRDADDRIRAA